MNPFIWSGIAGFSSIFFSLLIISVLYFDENKNYKFFWTLSLLTILTRPDGIVWIFAPILIRFFSLRKNNISEIKYILIISSIGIIYFVSRFLYFENFFPLPFYVKTNFNLLSIDSIVKYSFVLIPLFLTTIFYRKDINYNFIKKKRLATVTAVSIPGRFGDLEIDSNTNVKNFSEKKRSRKVVKDRINGGFMVIDPAVIKLIKNDKSNFEADTLTLLAKKNYHL